MRGVGSTSGVGQAEVACLAISEVNACRHWEIESVVSLSNAKRYVPVEGEIARTYSPHFPYQPCRACRNQQRQYLM